MTRERKARKGNQARRRRRRRVERRERKERKKKIWPQTGEDFILIHHSYFKVDDYSASTVKVCCFAVLQALWCWVGTWAFPVRQMKVLCMTMRRHGWRGTAAPVFPPCLLNARKYRFLIRILSYAFFAKNFRERVCLAIEIVLDGVGSREQCSNNFAANWPVTLLAKSM